MTTDRACRRKDAHAPHVYAFGAADKRCPGVDVLNIYREALIEIRDTEWSAPGFPRAVAKEVLERFESAGNMEHPEGGQS